MQSSQNDQAEKLNGRPPGVGNQVSSSLEANSTQQTSNSNPNQKHTQAVYNAQGMRLIGGINGGTKTPIEKPDLVVHSLNPVDKDKSLQEDLKRLLGEEYESLSGGGKMPAVEPQAGGGAELPVVQVSGCSLEGIAVAGRSRPQPVAVDTGEEIVAGRSRPQPVAVDTGEEKKQGVPVLGSQPSVTEEGRGYPRLVAYGAVKGEVTEKMRARIVGRSRRMEKAGRKSAVKGEARNKHPKQETQVEVKSQNPYLETTVVNLEAVQMREQDERQNPYVDTSETHDAVFPDPSLERIPRIASLLWRKNRIPASGLDGPANQAEERIPRTVASMRALGTAPTSDYSGPSGSSDPFTQNLLLLCEQAETEPGNGHRTQGSLRLTDETDQLTQEATERTERPHQDRSTPDQDQRVPSPSQRGPSAPQGEASPPKSGEDLPQTGRVPPQQDASGVGKIVKDQREGQDLVLHSDQSQQRRMDNSSGQSSSDDMGHGAPKTKNLYKVLGLTKTATEDDIKKAYRRLALKYHPDKNLENDPAKTDKFKEVNHAHTILSNKQKRQIYDTYGMMGLKMMEQLGEEKMTCIAKTWVKWAVCIFGIVTCGFCCCFCGFFCCCQCCCGFCCGKCRPSGMTGDQSSHAYVYESFANKQNQPSGGPKDDDPSLV